MNSFRAAPMSRSSSQSTDSNSGASVVLYTRTDQAVMLSFRVGDTVWARANGVWSPGVVVEDCDLERRQDGSATFTVFTRVPAPYAGFTLLTLSPLFGSLKPADTYTAALLRAEGLYPPAGTDRTDMLDLQVKAHGWMDRRAKEARKRRRL